MGEHGSVPPVAVLKEVLSKEAGRAHAEAERCGDGGVVVTLLAGHGVGSTEGEEER
ncbi:MULTISPECIES: hypothetical protein [Streptomyces]|uniref:hypothetical protein n=1 Tax=Streptomyces TaxID=1883 RepID=UPI00226D6B4A|nr:MULTISPECIES: hypothetical protein [unclassified Streptomyces]MCY0940110.1 hypothetical protein [Streptomyces sp. H34-AA3]MCZ4080758.1 hypothetical protein [Streptomyces sp. H34-S5]